MNAFPGKNSVLVVDNARVHKHDSFKQICAAKDIMLLYLPPYCPFWNPTELVFSQVKSYLRRYATEFHRVFGLSDFNDALLLQLAFDQVTPQNCENYFRKCLG